MAVLSVLSNGNAPANARVGDTIQTAGGNYNVVTADYPNAVYNPSSGLYSVRSDDYNKDLQQSVSVASANSAKSQSYAREQMEWQEEQNARAMEFNRLEAQKQRDWQTSMSSTAHQREVQDLIKAGLNPVLSALNGNGASVSSGASASGVTSSGSSGTVDTSANSTIASLYASALNASTSLALTDLNNKTAVKVAGINAKAQENVATTYTEMDKYIKQNYPDNPYRLVSSIWNYLVDNGIIKPPDGKTIDDLKSFLTYSPDGDYYNHH